MALHKKILDFFSKIKNTLKQSRVALLFFSAPASFSRGTPDGLKEIRYSFSASGRRYGQGMDPKTGGTHRHHAGRPAPG